MIKMIIAYVLFAYFAFNFVYSEVKKNIKKYREMKEFKRDIESGKIDEVVYDDNGNIIIISYKKVMA